MAVILIIMAEKDSVEKTLLSYNDVFADIVNVLIFGGDDVVKEADLTDAQTDSMYKAFGEIKSQARDVAKYWNKKNIHISCIGFENQSVINADMPFRVMNYDAAVYRKQIDDKKQAERYPVITLVLYFGTETEWKSNKTLLDRLSIADERLKPFISDYKINVINLAWLKEEEIELFKSDFRDVVEYLRAARLHETYEGSQKQINHIEEILDLFKYLSGNSRFDEIKASIHSLQADSKGGVKMFDVLQYTMDKKFALGEQKGFSLGLSKGRSEGRSEGLTEGRTEGISQMQNALANLYAQGREEDVKRALTDSAFLAELLSSYNLS